MVAQHSRERVRVTTWTENNQLGAEGFRFENVPVDI